MQAAQLLTAGTDTVIWFVTMLVIDSPTVNPTVLPQPVP
jgi:hypothetical protein